MHWGENNNCGHRNDGINNDQKKRSKSAKAWKVATPFFWHFQTLIWGVVVIIWMPKRVVWPGSSAWEWLISWLPFWEGGPKWVGGWICCFPLGVLMPLYVRMFYSTVGSRICNQIVQGMPRSGTNCLSVLDPDLIQTDLLIAKAGIGLGLSKFRIVLLSVLDSPM